MSMSSHLLERAIALWKIGQKAAAHKIFEGIIYNDRQNEAAWIWYVYTLETNREKIAALETFLSIFPHHVIGEKAHANLMAEELQHTVIQTNAKLKYQKNKNIRQLWLRPVQGGRSTLKSKPNFVSWLMVVIGLCLLLTSSTIFTLRYNSLQSQYQTLKVNNQIVTQNYAQLRQDFQALDLKSATLINDYNGLADKYNSLNTEYSILMVNYDTLYTEQTQLLEKYNALAGDYNTLNNIAIKPPYIVGVFRADVDLICGFESGLVVFKHCG